MSAKKKIKAITFLLLLFWLFTAGTYVLCGFYELSFDFYTWSDTVRSLFAFIAFTGWFVTFLITALIIFWETLP